MAVLEADLTWTGASFEAGVRLEIDDGGRLKRVGPLAEPPTTRLSGLALAPGFVNAHSHAFQIGLRGQAEASEHGASSFWTWREGMYALVEALDVEAFRAHTRAAFEEMLDAGITCVGEFHYLHHASANPDFELDSVVLEAAAEAGIRIVLIGVAYRSGRIGAALTGAQTRFATPSLERFWERLDARAARISPTQSLAVAAHSVRAVPIDDVVRLYRQARDRNLPFHMHVEEQAAEVDACLEAYGERPLRLLVRNAGLGPGFVAVHATQSEPDDLARLVDAGGSVCVCPLTEGALADGLPNLDPVLAGSNDALSLGTDSNARISFVEETRWLEYGQRLRTGRRGVIHDAAGGSGAALLRVATRGGARALGVAAGAIEPGMPADLVAIDLTHPSLAGADGASLADHWLLGSGSEAIAGTFVSGVWRARR